jgi:hypothetical protein
MTCSFTSSAPLEHTSFDISINSLGFIATSTTTISGLFVGSQRKNASDQLCHSTVLPKEAIAAVAQVARQPQGNPATRITLVAFASFVLLATVGVVIVVAFRRQNRMLTDSDSIPSNPVTRRIPGQATESGLATADLADYETEQGISNTEGNPCLYNEKETDDESIDFELTEPEEGDGSSAPEGNPGLYNANELDSESIDFELASGDSSTDPSALV